MKDPYLNSNGVLYNKPGITDGTKLREYEYRAVAGAEVALLNNPIKGNFDMDHLKGIHGALFGSVYDWAGKTRTVDIAKGDSYFATNSKIEGAGNKLFKELAGENHLKGLSSEDFSKRAAYYLGEINALHPFREGNGRSQRVFMTLLADNAGYDLDWTKANRKEMTKASIDSFNGDYRGLEKIIAQGLSEKTLEHTTTGPDKGTAAPQRFHNDRELDF